MQSLPPCWPYIRFLFVVVKELLHHFLHPSLAAFDLWFTTLGGKYLWSDFHRLAVCHARHTVMKPVLYFTIPVFHLLINPLNYDILKSEKTNFTARFYTSLFLVYTKKYYIKIFFKASDFREIPVSISERRKNIG